MRDLLTRVLHREGVLARLPTPQHWRRFLALLPPGLLVKTAGFALHLGGPSEIPGAALAFMEDRIVAIEIEDLGLHIQISARSGRLHLGAEGRAEVTISASTLDFLLLATQREDADTLFFHRRLRMTGDTALGLQLRNTLDQLAQDLLPARLRQELERFTDLAQAAQHAYRSAGISRARPASPYQ